MSNTVATYDILPTLSADEITRLRETSPAPLIRDYIELRHRIAEEERQLSSIAAEILKKFGEDEYDNLVYLLPSEYPEPSL